MSDAAAAVVCYLGSGSAFVRAWCGAGARPRYRRRRHWWRSALFDGSGPNVIISRFSVLLRGVTRTRGFFIHVYYYQRKKITR